MASVPARRPSQRRESPPEQQPQAPTQSPISESSIRSRSEDSQTIFVHRDEAEQEEQQEEQADTRQPSPYYANGDDASLTTCWICYTDASETGSERGPWRDPCPCSLTAHEDCLLDWIADMEVNNRKGTTSMTAPKIECPQCKSEIKIARPRDYLVDTVMVLKRAGDKIVTPGALAALSGLLYGSFAWIGTHSIYAVFGASDGYQILRPMIQNAARPPIEVYAGDPRGLTNALSEVFMDHVVHWRLYIGVPLITPVLLLSRIHYADGILPVLPIVFFASQVHSPDTALDFAQWPPSASFCFALLPYVRSMYNFYYQKVWAAKERQWRLKLLPKAMQERARMNDELANAELANAELANPRRNDDNVFEVRIDGGIWDDRDNEDQLEQAVAENNAMNNLQAQQEDEAAPGPNVADNRPLPQGGANEQPNVAQPAPRQQQNGNGERRLAFSPIGLAATALGALCFPTIAGLSGELLKLILPNSWTAPAPAPTRFWGKSMPVSRNFLQQKWARSLIGGCLFVVCKDAVMLYVRWKMVQMHRKRSIVDYNRRGGASQRGAAS